MPTGRLLLVNPDGTVIDGELVALDSYGRPDFKVIGVTKLNIACFNCESTSYAIVTTSIDRVLKSTPHKFLCKVLKMLACKIRDSSTTIVAV